MTSVPSRWVVTEANLATSPDVFPQFLGQSFPIKSPEFNNVSRYTASGRRSVTPLWSVPRWNFQISYEAIRQRLGLPEVSQLWAFFCTALAGYGAWFYHDPYDDTVINGSLGTGDGTTSEFQATRTLGAGTAYAFDDVVNAFWLEPVVYVDGVATTAFTVQAWGVIRFNTPPVEGAVLTWTGKFLFACEFNETECELTQLALSLFSSSGLKFRTIKQ